MPIWTANDDPTGRPNYANTSDVYGVDSTEALVISRDVVPGWVRVTDQTGPVSYPVIVNGGTGYTNADYITIDGVTTPGVVNATANLIVGFGANVSGTLNFTSGQVNATAAGIDLTTVLANGYQVFAYSNSTASQVRTINKVVNSTFMNVTSAWTATNAAAQFGKAGVITSIANFSEGSGFTTQSNLAFTTSAGLAGNVSYSLVGRAGRRSYETLVAVRNMTGDAEDTVFPDA